MIRKLVHDPSFLKLRSSRATAADREVITDLLDTLGAHREECVGMAANMIGIRKNVIVVNIGMLNMAMVNPVIVKKTGPYQTSEGCLSLLGGPRPVTRYQQIEVTYQDTNFVAHTKSFEGFIAQIIQHEVDHLNGVLI